MSSQTNRPFVVGLIDLTPNGRTPQANRLRVLLRRLRRPKQRASLERSDVIDTESQDGRSPQPLDETRGSATTTRPSLFGKLWKRFAKLFSFEWKGIDNGSTKARKPQPPLSDVGDKAVTGRPDVNRPKANRPEVRPPTKNPGRFAATESPVDEPTQDDAPDTEQAETEQPDRGRLPREQPDSDDPGTRRR